MRTKFWPELLCCAVLLFLLTGCHGVRTPPAVPTPTTAPVPTWRGIVPGVSTEADVVRLLGEPVTKNVFEDKAAYAYHGDRQWPIFFFFHHGRVTLIGDTRVSEPSLSLFLAKYGEPEKVTWAPRGSYPSTRMFIFARHGMAIVADNLVSPGESIVRQKWYFVPTTLDHFLNEVAPPHLVDSDPLDSYPEDYWVREGEDE